jgi:predicted MFS family arabinose efflux permease
MLAMVLFGFGEIFGCFFIGYFIDGYGSKFSVVVNLLIIIIMSLATLVFVWDFSFGFFAYFMCFMWGFQDSAVHTHTFEILGFEFEDNYTPFSLFGIWESLACFICQLVLSRLRTKLEYSYYSMLACVLGFVCCGMIFFFPFRDKRSQQTSLKSIMNEINPSESTDEKTNDDTDSLDED